MPKARQTFRFYCERLKQLMHRFAVKDEGDLFAGFSLALQNTSSTPQPGSLSDGLTKRPSVRCRMQSEVNAFLKHFYEDYFLNDGPPSSAPSAAESRVGNDTWQENEVFYLQKASAWYCVSYEVTLCSAAPASTFHSFPWLAYQQLCTAKQRASQY